MLDDLKTLNPTSILDNTQTALTKPIRFPVRVHVVYLDSASAAEDCQRIMERQLW